MAKIGSGDLAVHSEAICWIAIIVTVVGLATYFLFPWEKEVAEPESRQGVVLLREEVAYLREAVDRFGSQVTYLDAEYQRLREILEPPLIDD